MTAARKPALRHTTDAQADEREHLRSTFKPFSTDQAPIGRLGRAALALEAAGRAQPEAIFDPRAQTGAPLTPQQQKNLFRQVFLDEKLTLADLEPARVRVVYRLVRELARVRELLRPNEPLTVLREEDWTEASTQAIPAKPFFTRHWKLAEVLQEANDLAPAGLPLLPPPIPQAEHPDSYRPGADRRLKLYMEALERISEYLNVMRGPKYDRNLGRHGLAGVLNPQLIRFVFPSVEQLITFEKLVISETLNKMIEQGQVAAEEQLKDRHGYEDGEILGFISMAREYAVEKTKSELEQDRAMMILNWEHLAKRAVDAMDLRAEAYAYKALSVIKGLNKLEPEDMTSEFAKIIGRVSQERERERELKTIEAKTIRQLPAG